MFLDLTDHKDQSHKNIYKMVGIVITICAPCILYLYINIYYNKYLYINIKNI